MGVDTMTLRTFKEGCAGVAAVSMGFYFGARFAGEQAKPVLLAMETEPEWMATVKTANLLALGVFALSVGGYLLLDYKTR